MTRTRSFTPSQLRELRSDMEEDFARVLRSMTNAHADDSFSTESGWRPRQSESDELDTVLHERQHARLAAITAALRRLDTGAYGECARCGRRISFGRLSVMPDATLCRACGGTGRGEQS